MVEVTLRLFIIYAYGKQIALIVLQPSNHNPGVGGFKSLLRYQIGGSIERQPTRSSYHCGWRRRAAHGGKQTCAVAGWNQPD